MSANFSRTQCTLLERATRREAWREGRTRRRGTLQGRGTRTTDGARRIDPAKARVPPCLCVLRSERSGGQMARDKSGEVVKWDVVTAERASEREAWLRAASSRAECGEDVSGSVERVPPSTPPLPFADPFCLHARLEQLMKCHAARPRARGRHAPIPCSLTGGGRATAAPLARVAVRALLKRHKVHTAEAALSSP